MTSATPFRFADDQLSPFVTQSLDAVRSRLLPYLTATRNQQARLHTLIPPRRPSVVPFLASVMRMQSESGRSSFFRSLLADLFAFFLFHSV